MKKVEDKPKVIDPEKVSKGVIGSAIYAGAFIMAWILFGFRLPMCIALMIWGNNVVYTYKNK